MKKLRQLLFLIVVCSLFAACSAEDDKIINHDEDIYVTFRGTIDKILNEDRAIVLWEKNGRTSRIFVDLSVNSSVTFQVGDEVIVGYDGIVKESNPGQINTLSVELAE